MHPVGPLQWLGHSNDKLQAFNSFTATFSDALHNASVKPFYQITHIIYLLEITYKIIPYRLGKPKAFLD